MQPSDSTRHLSVVEEDILLLALENVLQPGRFTLLPEPGAAVRNGPDLAPGEEPRNVPVRDEVLRLLARGLVDGEAGSAYRLTPAGWTQAEATRASRLALLETQQLPDDDPSPADDPSLSHLERRLLRAARQHGGELSLLRASGGTFLSSLLGPGPLPLQAELDRLVALGFLRRTPLASTSRVTFGLTRAGDALAGEDGLLEPH